MYLQVAEIVSICKAKGWVQPRIYQACVQILLCFIDLSSQCSMYNAITRAIEPELIPCCRKFGIRVVVYNPLAYVIQDDFLNRRRHECYSGGLFSGKITSIVDAPTTGRFITTTASGKLYRDRYLRNGNFDALNHLKDVAVRVRSSGSLTWAFDNFSRLSIISA
jgi:aflatoxin B1 aldehyde reductase